MSVSHLKLYFFKEYYGIFRRGGHRGRKNALGITAEPEYKLRIFEFDLSLPRAPRSLSLKLLYVTAAGPDMSALP